MIFFYCSFHYYRMFFIFKLTDIKGTGTYRIFAFSEMLSIFDIREEECEAARADSVKTHPNFKSFVPDVHNANAMNVYFWRAIYFQYEYEKRTSPWERKDWDEEELEDFEINLPDINRLYYFRYDDSFKQEYDIIFRMDYKGHHLYVHLSTHITEVPRYDCPGGIYVSRDPNLFMKVIVLDMYNKNLIYQSLLAEGIHVEEPTEHFSVKRISWRNTPSLMFLCCQTVYDHKKFLEKCYPRVLPEMISECVTDFIRTKDAKHDYDAWYDLCNWYYIRINK